ncbi:MAG: hydrogenase formation protein HypD [Clostridiales bacterium]|nr:hydrogenase formation protein HypD [Clostridiales bacterium]
MSTIEEARSYLENYDGPDFRIMEVCGTHTHEIFRQGIRRILSPKINLISGPGCPVCVTPVSFIDEAVYLALEKGCTITTFGDLVRVPGSKMSLAGARAKGAKIKVVYAPFDAVKIAQDNPEEQVVFLSVGFETTTPSDVIAVKKAMAAGLKNFSILTANKTMPGAYEAMGKSCDAFLYPGHVHAITGTQICKDMCEKGVSGVIAGFTGSELLTALAVAVKKFGEGKPFFVNCYPRVVKDEGSPAAVAMVDKFMEPCDAEWRGIGTIPMSGMQLRDEYAEFDARKKYDVPQIKPEYKTACRCGDVLQGKITPNECPLFGKACNPDHPVGACMVSDEGACSAFYMYGGEL